MNIAERYAQTIYQASVNKSGPDFDVFFDNFIGLLKQKNHYKILPSILDKVSGLQNNAKASEKTILVVREEALAEGYKKELEKHSEVFRGEIETQVDEHVVGGFIAKNKTNMIDQSYRSKLLQMYRKLTA